MASEIVEKPNQPFRKVATFLRKYATLAGDASAVSSERAFVGREKNSEYLMGRLIR